MQMEDGSVVPRKRDPQGGVVSPALANLFLHYAFDMWMVRTFPRIPFERYADDAICHCRTEDQAIALRTALETRFADCGLTLHPDKTKAVYCRDESRRENHPTLTFDFLGYSFPAEDGEQKSRRNGRLVQSRSQHKRAHGDPSDDPELVNPSAQ